MIRLWKEDLATIVNSFKAHAGAVSAVAFDPTGRTLASRGNDGMVKLWRISGVTAELIKELKAHTSDQGMMTDLAWATFNKPFLRANESFGISFDPSGRYVAYATIDGVKLWDTTNARSAMTLGSRIMSLAFDPSGRTICGASEGGTVEVWEIGSWKQLMRVSAHRSRIDSVAFDSSGNTLCSASEDGAIKIWAVVGARLLRTLEGHLDAVNCVSLAGDSRLLASKSLDSTVRLWDLDTGAIIAEIPELSSRNRAAGIAFHPSSQILASVGSDDGAPSEDADSVIHIWELDHSYLSSQAISPTISYARSAKIVIVGESNVGKSFLAYRIATGQPPASSLQSTHGMKVWSMDAERLSATAVSQSGQRREIVLWDLGGQAEYRLVHQLFLHDTTIALMLLDPTRGRTAFEEVEAWNKRLEQQLQGRSAVKFLIGAKVDQQSDIIDFQSLEKLQKDCGMAAYFETSALTGRGIPDLCEAIASVINWDAMGETSRPQLFQQIRDEIDGRRHRGEVILHEKDLHRALEHEPPTREQAETVKTVTGQLAAQGIIARANISTGEAVLVLQIHEIERYAGSLIIAARNNPRDVPALELQTIGGPNFTLPGIESATRLPRAHERSVLECTVQLLLEHGICFHHEGLLVFPSLFPLVSSVTPTKLAHAVSLYYDFAGAIDNVYASLIAWLVLARDFGRVRLWADRAEFEVGNRGLCGIRKVPRPGGFAHMDLYFVSGTPPALQERFIDFVEEHLRQHGMEIQEHAEITCPCGNKIEDETVRRRIARGDKDVVCSVCETRHNLVEGAADSRHKNPQLTSLTWALKTEIERRRKKSAQDAVEVIEKSPEVGSDLGSIRILHLSDLHFTAETHVATQMQWLLEDLRQPELGIGQIDYLVISGDFTNRGSTAGLSGAYKFVSDLARELKLSAERCVLVPGNHDITDLREAYEWRESAVGLAEGDWIRQGDIILARNSSTYDQRFKAFSDRFYHVFLQKPFPLEPSVQGFAIPFWETGIQFLTLNSSWQIDRFYRKRAGIHPAAIAHIVREAQEQEAEARRSGLLPSNRNLLRIAVWHHAVAGAGQMLDTTFLGHLQNLGVRVALHGDVHELRRDLIGYWHPRKMYVIGCGSFGADKTDRPESTPRSYNLLEISRDLKKVRVHTRCQRKSDGPWAGWHEWQDPAGGQGAVAYYDFEP
jgi:small GTP-binding protein